MVESGKPGQKGRQNWKLGGSCDIPEGDNGDVNYSDGAGKEHKWTDLQTYLGGWKDLICQRNCGEGDEWIGDVKDGG